MYKSLADLCPHWEFSSENMFASYCPGSVRMQDHLYLNGLSPLHKQK